MFHERNIIYIYICNSYFLFTNILNIIPSYNVEYTLIISFMGFVFTIILLCIVLLFEARVGVYLKSFIYMRYFSCYRSNESTAYERFPN